MKIPKNINTINTADYFTHGDDIVIEIKSEQEYEQQLKNATLYVPIHDYDSQNEPVIHHYAFIYLPKSTRPIILCHTEYKNKKTYKDCPKCGTPLKTHQPPYIGSAYCKKCDVHYEQ